MRASTCVLLAAWLCAAAPLAAQTARANGDARPPAPAPPFPVTPPLDYVIGPKDILTVVFWREKDISGDVVVRPDGRISLPLLDDIDAAGLTPAQLKAKLEKESARFLENPTVSIVVKQINSRMVFITGQVAKPGEYSLTGPMTVVQLIAMAGGLTEYADSEKISVLRVEKGWPTSYPFNYKRLANRKYLRENILLKPGDTVIVP